MVPVIGALCVSLIHFPAMAQEKATEKTASPTLFDSPMFVALFILAALLMLVIIIFAQVAKAAIQLKAEQEKAKKAGGTALKTVILLIAMAGMASTSVFAQEAVAPQPTAATSVVSPVPVARNDYWGMDGATFYLLVVVIAFELFVAWQLYNVAVQQMGVRERKQRLVEEKKKTRVLVKRPSLMEKLNDSVAIEKEADIMLDHNYDGIRELDNNLPPWWKYGFYLTIVFAVVYLFHFHVLHTGKLQLAEYQQQLAQAKYDMEVYRKHAANLVDENNATLLTDAASLAAGKATFTANCVACHGNAGEGGVGPNLTDDYWLHQGGIKDVFKTIKYGYPEKGMKSWEQDLGAKQIHEVASYIKSLHGTHPANPKEPQGDLYRDADTTAVAK